MLFGYLDRIFVVSVLGIFHYLAWHLLTLGVFLEMILIHPPKIIPVIRKVNKALPVSPPFYSFFPVPKKSTLNSIRIPQILDNLSFIDLRLRVFVPPTILGTNIPFILSEFKR